MVSFTQTVKRSLNALPEPLAFRVEELIATARRNPWQMALRDRLCRLYDGAGRPEAVMQGPFRGMKLHFYPASGAMAYAMMCHFLGTYEMELHGAVETICAGGHDAVIDIGSADGYYLVGFAKRLPRTRIIGFESQKNARHLARLNHRLNGEPGRILQRGWCDPDALTGALSGAARPAVICDVDGGEHTLLNPERIPALRLATILAEVHDPLMPGVAVRLLDRFGDTHDINIIHERERTPADRPPECPLSDQDFLDAAAEFRQNVPGLWYFMRPKAPAGRVEHG